MGSDDRGQSRKEADIPGVIQAAAVEGLTSLLSKLHHLDGASKLGAPDMTKHLEGLMGRSSNLAFDSWTLGLHTWRQLLELGRKYDADMLPGYISRAAVWVDPTAELATPTTVLELVKYSDVLDSLERMLCEAARKAKAAADDAEKQFADATTAAKRDNATGDDAKKAKEAEATFETAKNDHAAARKRCRVQKAETSFCGVLRIANRSKYTHQLTLPRTLELRNADSRLSMAQLSYEPDVPTLSPGDEVEIWVTIASWHLGAEPSEARDGGSSDDACIGELVIRTRGPLAVTVPVVVKQIDTARPDDKKRSRDRKELRRKRATSRGAASKRNNPASQGP